MREYVFGDKTLDYILRPILDYLNDPRTTDIVINRPFQVGVRRDGVWEWIEVPSFDEDMLDAATILIGYRNGREFDESHPYLNATMPGGQRFQAVRRPGTTIGHFLWAIRRPPTIARTMNDDDVDDLLADVNEPNIQRVSSTRSLGSAYRNKDWREVLRGARMGGLSIGICGATGDGKAQPYNSNVLTPTGFRPIGDIKVGDPVQTPCGSVAHVVGVFPRGEKEIYRVTFSDGRFVECCDEHLWKVWEHRHIFETGKTHETRKRINGGAHWTVAPLSEIRSGSRKWKRAAVPLVSPYAIEHPEQDLPIPPYVMGVILGDGALTEKDWVTQGARFSSADVAIVDRLHVELPEYQCMTGVMASTVQGYPRRSPLISAFHELGLFGKRSHNKFIPEIYKRGSVAQRLALLQGLLDTDGSVAGKGTYATFSSTSEQLARDVQAIAWSLGAIAPIRPRQTYYTYKGERRAGKPSWRVSIVMPGDVSCLFSLPRKVAECSTKKMRHRLRITSIESVGIKPAVCIAIDHPEHLYVTDNYVVTHNSDIGRRLVQDYRPHVRMVTIETDDEVGNAGPANKAPLIYDDTQISSDEALRIAKRLVPVEIVLQEVRGAEAWSLLLALNSGHNGLTSWHANEGEEIEALADMARHHPAAADMSDSRLLAKCRNAFDVIAYAKRTDRKRHDNDKGFRITSIKLRAAELEAAT